MLNLKKFFSFKNSGTLKLILRIILKLLELNPGVKVDGSDKNGPAHS